MAYKTCPDCGSKMYSGYCTNCHEEHFIYEQNQQNDELIGFSRQFLDKVSEQDEIARKNRKKDKQFIKKDLKKE